MALQGGTGIPTGGGSIGLLGNNYNTQPITLSGVAQGGGIQLQGPNQTAANSISIPGTAQVINNTPASGSGVYTDPAAAAQLAAAQAAAGQLQDQINGLDPQLATGLSNIGNSYNLGANRLDQQKAVAQRDYNLRTGQNTQGYSNNRNAIIQNTRNQASALQRLLGLNGAGNSSAAYEAAPYAAGLQGTQQLTGAQQTYGQNAQNLDTSWQDTQFGYQNAFNDLNNQKYQQENGLRSSIAQTKANLLSQLATAQGNPGAFNTDISGLLAQVAQLGNQYANPVLRTSDVSYATPNLSDYILKPGQAAAAQPAGAASEIAPSFLGLLTQQRDPYGNIIQA